MSTLTADEAAAAQADVQDLIEAMGTLVTLFAAAQHPSGSFAGDRPPSMDVMGTSVSVFAQDRQPSDLLQVDHDYVLSMLPEVAVAEGDELVFRGGRFTVVDIQEVRLFGTTTHRNMAVKKLRGS